jgi:hypothetical protein
MLYNRFADAGKKLGDGDIAILDVSHSMIRPFGLRPRLEEGRKREGPVREARGIG